MRTSTKHRGGLGGRGVEEDDESTNFVRLHAEEYCKICTNIT